jgi:hypothetical protein
LVPAEPGHVPSVRRSADLAGIDSRFAAVETIPCFEQVGISLAWITPEKKRGEKYDRS